MKMEIEFFPQRLADLLKDLKVNMEERVGSAPRKKF